LFEKDDLMGWGEARLKYLRDQHLMMKKNGNVVEAHLVVVVE